MKKILIGEGDPEIEKLLTVSLSEAGYRILVVRDGVGALYAFKKDVFDLVLMDAALPSIDGFRVCEIIRRESNVPIVMLVAPEDEQKRIRGAVLGGCTYLKKPVYGQELVNKVENSLCFLPAGAGRDARKNSGVLVCRNLTLDTNLWQASVNNCKINLTRKEFALLRELMLHQGQVLTRRILLDRVWGINDYRNERIVDTYIKRLRKKFGDGYILTVRGMGYRMVKG